MIHSRRVILSYVIQQKGDTQQKDDKAVHNTAEGVVTEKRIHQLVTPQKGGAQQKGDPTKHDTA